VAKELYKYQFSKGVPLGDIEETLLLAVLAAESLHGQSSVRLDAGYHLDKDKRACVIDAGTAVGRDINRLFMGFALREFGEDSLAVERVEDADKPGRTGAAP
jgi:hypothetical protein